MVFADQAQINRARCREHQIKLDQL